MREDSPAGKKRSAGQSRGGAGAARSPEDHSAEAREAFRLLAPYFRKRSFPAGSMLWHKGEQAKLVVAIDRGNVKIFRPLPGGGMASIFVFGPGDLFGFMPFFDGKPYPASAMAIDDVLAGTLSREGLLQALREKPEVVFSLFAFLGRRLRDAFDRIEILSGHGVLTRVAAALIRLTPEDAGEKTVVVHLPMSSGEFARTLGITPESFSRAVTILADMDLVRRLGRGRLQILEPGSLRRIGFPSGL